MNNLETIKNYISSNESQVIDKKQKGEVFTPYEIINKMLSELDPQLFSNPKLKWFDSSAGSGNFMTILFYKLNLGLKNIIQSKSKRKKHILENMLYMSELSEKNIKKCEEYFNLQKTYKLNLYCGDSLELDINKHWNQTGFDIIIGNPPYQKENKANNKARGGTNNNLYIDFIKKSIQQLNPDGYLVYIHPQNWRKIGTTILPIFLKYKLCYLALNYGGKLFKNVSVNTDFYILQNSNNNLTFKTKVDNYDNKNKLTTSSQFKIDNIPFIPKLFTEEIQSILIKIEQYGEKRECIINSDCHKIREHVVHKNKKTDKHIYPLFNTSGNPFDYFSSKKHKDQDKKKVIMSCSGKLGPFYDDGKYGTTQDSMYFFVETDQEGEQLVNILNSNLYIFLIKICQWGNFRNEQKLLSHLRYSTVIDKVDNTYINDYFKLTEAEKLIIQ